MKKILPFKIIPGVVNPMNLQRFEDELLKPGLVFIEDGNCYYEEDNEELVMNLMDSIFIPNFNYNDNENN